MKADPYSLLTGARRPGPAHVLPFAAWLAVMLVRPDHPLNYPLRLLAATALLLVCRPWRFYERPAWRDLLPGLLGGLGVFALWVGLETDWAVARWPVLTALYARWGVLGRPEAPSAVPASAAWLAARLAGSALVIAMAEEYFWRGFAYRRLQQDRFLEVDPGRLSLPALAMTALAFGFEHNRWLAGILAGLVYQLLYIRTRRLWSAIIAHITTNAILGAYVIAGGHYRFW